MVEITLQTGIFPESEKPAVVRPKLKCSEDFDTMEYYRPIYKASMISKFMEIAALRQLNTYISKFEFFSKFRSANRKITLWKLHCAEYTTNLSSIMQMIVHIARSPRSERYILHSLCVNAALGPAKNWHRW